MFNVSSIIRRMPRFAFAGLAVVAVVSAPAGAGTVTLVSQTHSISVSPGGGGSEDVVDAPATGTFDETLTRTANANGYDATATGSLNATFADNLFSFTGGMSYAASNAPNGNEFADGPTITISAQYVFSVDAPFKYELRNSTNLINPDPGALDEADDQFFGENIQQGDTVDGTQFGVIQPGTYTFNLNHRVTSFTINPDTTRDFETEFDRSLVLSPVDGDGGGPNPAVPLPPAALAAGSVFGAMGLLRGGKRLYRRAQ